VSETEELKKETTETFVASIGLVFVGAMLLIVEGPRFHHGLMIGAGLMLPLTASWRKRALLSETAATAAQGTTETEE